MEIRTEVTDKRERRHKRLRIREFVFTVLGTLLAAALILYAVYAIRAYVRGGEAREVLREAKVCLLAAESVGKSAHSGFLDYGDFDSTEGLTSEASDKIYELSGCVGEFRVISLDPSGYSVARMEYIENGYIAEYDRTEENPWIVYRVETIID